MPRIAIPVIALLLGACASTLAQTPEQAIARDGLSNLTTQRTDRPECDGGSLEYSGADRDGGDVCGEVCCVEGECQVSVGDCGGNPFSGIADGTHIP